MTYLAVLALGAGHSPLAEELLNSSFSFVSFSSKPTGFSPNGKFLEQKVAKVAKGNSKRPFRPSEARESRDIRAHHPTALS